MSMFDPIELSSDDDSSSEDDTPLSLRIAHKEMAPVQMTLPGMPSVAVPTEEKWPAVPREGETLTGQAYIDRAYKLRERAQAIFESEKKHIIDNTLVGDAEKKHLTPYTLVFDRGTRRRGVCKYPSSKRPRGYIGLSAKMVDGGTPADKLVNVIRHELSHACKPGMKHNAVWKQFDLMIGGDGKRCCSDEEIKAIIGHRIEVYCPNDIKHFLKKMQKRPSQKWLTSKVCKTCRSHFLVRGASN